MTKQKCSRCKRMLELGFFYIDKKTREHESECAQCKKVFNTNDYYLGSICKRGHDWSNTKESLRSKSHGHCVICIREQGRRKRRICVASSMVREARARAKEKGWEFNLSKDLMYELNDQQQGKCVYTGVELDWDRQTSKVNEKNQLRVSLDRIDSSKGYTRENVQLVTTIANISKNVQTHEEFITFCKIVAEKFKDTD
jgi:hypothetical protein